MTTDTTQHDVDTIDYQALLIRVLDLLQSEAEERDWCDEYEDFLAELNLPPHLRNRYRRDDDDRTELHAGHLRVEYRDAGRRRTATIPITLATSESCICVARVDRLYAHSVLANHLGPIIGSSLTPNALVSWSVDH